LLKARATTAGTACTGRCARPECHTVAGNATPSAIHRAARPALNGEPLTGYEHFARFYDALMGDPLANAARVRGYRERHLPAADSLLELGCGSGAILAGLGGIGALVGLDRSPAMLAAAARNVPRARLVQADMTTFELGVGLAQIAAALAGDFELLESADDDGEAPTEESVRAYFAYRAR